MNNLYYIVNIGCDDATHGLAIISDEEFPHFKQIITELNENSIYGCMPTIEVYKIDESFIRPANDVDNDYDILHLDGNKYVLAKNIFKNNGKSLKLEEGVEQIC